MSSAMNWIQRKVYLYNVTFGLYMLDWWERFVFNTVVIVFIGFMLYNSSKYVNDLCKSDLSCLVTLPFKKSTVIVHESV